MFRSSSFHVDDRPLEQVVLGQILQQIKKELRSCEHFNFRFSEGSGWSIERLNSPERQKTEEQLDHRRKGNHVSGFF